MTRVLEIGSMLIGGELLAYGWRDGGAANFGTITNLAANNSLWALVCGAVATGWALQRITARSSRSRDSTAANNESEKSLHHYEKRD